MSLLRDERGSAMVELAAILSVMVLMLMGTVDYAAEMVYDMQIQQAATAAAEFGAIPGNESNLAQIQAYAVTLAPYISGVTATATNTWTCSPGGASVVSTSTCSGGVTPYKYLTVTTTATTNRIVKYPGLPPTMTMKGTATIRVPWTK
jgi:Flp pilus assembly protein TadG